MRFALLLMLLLTAVRATAQNSGKMHARLGDIDLERFPVGNGVNGPSLTVEYGSDHSACRIVLEIMPLVQDASTNADMSRKAVEEMLAKAVPLKERGILLSRSTESMGGATAEVRTYQRVTIHILEDSGNDPLVSKAIVLFRRLVCTPFTAGNLPHY